MTVRKAERKKAKLRLGIAAPSGAGKTMGALLLAFGITGDWSKIGIIDTEGGSGELYVGQKVSTPEGEIVIGEYLYSRIDPEYEVKKYINAQREMEAAGAEVVILDSISHAWAGSGGLLDKKGKIEDRTGSGFTAWRTVTPEHNDFVEGMTHSPVHIIATLRSKQEYVQEKNEQGKTIVRKVGMAPVQREGMEYEFTVMLDIDMSHIASSTKDRTNTLDGKFFKISPKTGETLLDWLNLGKEPEKDIKQLTKEFGEALMIVPDAEALENHIKANAVLISRLATEVPNWHRQVLDKIEQKRAFFALPPRQAQAHMNGTATTQPVQEGAACQA